MEKYTVFMDWKNQHCQNGHTTQSNLQIQCNPPWTLKSSYRRRTGSLLQTIQMVSTPQALQAASLTLAPAMEVTGREVYSKGMEGGIDSEDPPIVQVQIKSQPKVTSSQ